ncbi:MAG TPA: ribonuclease P protein component [bacterium]|nr:ribonuclease P protein component [bacterium]
MLEKKYRLTLQKDFDLTFKTGKYKNLPNFLTLHYRPATENELKIAFIISKKTEKLANKRHLNVRQSRHIIQTLLKDNKIKSGYHLIFILRPNYTQLDFQEKTNKMIEIIKSAGLLN